MSSSFDDSTLCVHTNGQHSWFSRYSDYLLGGLFGLISLDLFLFLMHCISEKTISGYGLSSLVITLALAILVAIERLYATQAPYH